MRSILSGLGAAAVLVAASSAQAVNVQITPSSTLLGFMNWTDSRDAGLNGASGWGVSDLRATYTGNVLKLEAAPINDSNTYWYLGAGTNPGGPGVAGSKTMDANVYVQDDALAGQSVVFSGNVLQNSFVQGYSSVAFIKDFAADYSSNTTVTVPLTPGAFSVTLATSAAGGHHIQYGFETLGANVWPTDIASKGFATVTSAVAVPEPMSLTAVAAAGLLVGRRRRA